MKFTKKQLEENEARAEMCSEATIPGDQLRELIRLAIIGFELEQAQDED